MPGEKGGEKRGGNSSRHRLQKRKDEGGRGGRSGPRVCPLLNVPPSAFNVRGEEMRRKLNALSSPRSHRQEEKRAGREIKRM